MIETHNQHSGRGFVVLDIGAEHGALVVHAHAAMEGAEIEISPEGRDDQRQHVAVLHRPVPAGPAYAAVYPSLAAGPYRLWRSDGTPATTVHIVGGRVTHSTWPDPPQSPGT